MKKCLAWQDWFLHSDSNKTPLEERRVCELWIKDPDLRAPLSELVTFLADHLLCVLVLCVVWNVHLMINN